MTTKRAKPNSSEFGPTDFALDDLVRCIEVNRLHEGTTAHLHLYEHLTYRGGTLGWNRDPCEYPDPANPTLAFAVVGPIQEVGR